jgi:hypothetical protein
VRSARPERGDARQATPTIKDVFPAGDLRPPPDELYAPLDPPPTLAEEARGIPRRKAMILAVVLMVVAAFVAFLVAGSVAKEEEPARPPGKSERR